MWQSHTGPRRGVLWGECYEVFGILQEVTPGEIPASMRRPKQSRTEEELAAGGEDVRGPRRPLSWPQGQVFVV